ncbi:hypothetical protein BDV95DRAFT_587035 [Massariosphaeria phaeospora]|uniref:Uncharacterized protein n=1 Tax=Massariosphaeria phaeospora TaxID=100035 RepID=A0A7C8HYL2_9PLEO|nr:hypothetical protein BDV95DRAFT_587035 [Massariosphaeria phaeospora]
MLGVCFSFLYALPEATGYPGQKMTIRTSRSNRSIQTIQWALRFAVVEAGIAFAKWPSVGQRCWWTISWTPGGAYLRAQRRCGPV